MILFNFINYINIKAISPKFKDFDKGIDVSSWQQDIDWKQVKKSGIKFAMIRCGYGKSSNQIDRKFHNNIKQAQNAGIDVGVYHYSYAQSTDDALEEAKSCIKIIKDYKLQYPVAFDIEDPSIEKLDKRIKTDICDTFCTYIQEQGYKTCIYTNPNWLKNHLYYNELFPKFDLWLAHWGVEKPSFPCIMWQYSSKGQIDGINTYVDLNVISNKISNINKVPKE